jgi:cyclopropane-fatty-acyl-phospholipid synthase
MQYPLRQPLDLSDLEERRAPAIFGPLARPRGATALDRWCLSQVGRAAAGVPLRIVLWDGTTATAADGEPRFTIYIRSRATLLGLVRDPDLGFGEGYLNGDIRVDGDVYALVDGVACAMAARAGRMGRLRRRLAHMVGADITGARRNAQYHYDLGNDFYRLWLDDAMVYTCAYYPTPDASLEEAQQAKLEHVSRKVQLAPGDRVFEAGCGWGALALHMARKHGVTVRAWNVSHEQIAAARARAAAERLDERVQFIEDDWRHIDGACDVFVSIGMLEHVGPSRYRELGRIIDRSLHPRHGRGLLHFIGHDVEAPASRWTRKYAFPGFYVPTLREVLGGVLEPYGFAVTDVEDLRRHYARTLEHWRDRYERAVPTVTAQFGERFTRTWRYYLAGAHAGFTSGYLQLFQVAFTRRAWDGGTWVRPA